MSNPCGQQTPPNTGDRRDSVPTDRQLLERFVGHKDETAFAELVRRHGPMVLGVCRRVLRDHEEADDAFQATFIVLARRARLIFWQESVAAWLCRVAYRIAGRAGLLLARRKAHEKQAAQMVRVNATSDGASQAGWQELRPAIDQELDRLPTRYRLPIVLCYLEGKTNDEAAAHLGWTRGTVAGRLSRARELLRARLSRRGIVLTAGALAAILVQNAAAAALPATLVVTTVKAATLAAAGKAAAAGVVSANVAVLADAGMKTLAVAKIKAAALAVGLSMAVSSAGLVAYQLAGSAPLVLPAVLAAHQGEVLACALSPQGDLLATGGADRTTRIWDLASRRERTVLKGHVGWITGLAFAPDGQTLATSSWDFRVRLWDVASGKEKAAAILHEGGVDAIVFTPDGKTLMSAGGPHHPPQVRGEIKLWDAATLQPAGVLATNQSWIHSIALASHGRWLASGGEDGAVMIWDILRRQLHVSCPGHRGGVLKVAFSPDGATVASAGKDGTVKLWDAATGREKVTCQGHVSEVWSVAFAPDGQTIASGGVDMTVRLWDAVTGRERAVLKGHQKWVGALTFSPDGQTLVSTDWAGAVRFWDPAMGQEKTRP